MREIPLTHGYVALVDDADYELVAAFKWHVYKSNVGGLYAARSTYQRGQPPGRMLMHRLILGAGPGVAVDHKNGNGIDNTRANLRFATALQNGFNSRPRRGRRFKGTSWQRKGKGAWQAEIKVGKMRRYLGRFRTEEDAARAYDAAAKELQGEFAWLNFPTV